MICDCGGGTVVRFPNVYCLEFIISHQSQDLTTYYVPNVEVRLGFEQITTASSGMIYKKKV